MVKVRLFGVFRLDSGVRELSIDASRVKDIFPIIVEEVKKKDPHTAITVKDLKGCIIAVNGNQVGIGAKLTDGDEVLLVPAVAGG